MRGMMNTYYFVACKTGELVWMTEEWSIGKAINAFRSTFPGMGADEVFVTDSSGF
jgi:hypothetical protein